VQVELDCGDQVAAAVQAKRAVTVAGALRDGLARA
jgi:hypothetical protein